MRWARQVAHMGEILNAHLTKFCDTIHNANQIIFNNTKLSVNDQVYERI